MADKFANHIQVDTGDVIRTKSITYSGSVVNNIIIGKQANIFHGRFFSYDLKGLTQADMYADIISRRSLVSWLWWKLWRQKLRVSESPVYWKFQVEDRLDSNQINFNSVFKQVLKLEPRYEDNDVQETKYGKLGFEEAMRDNP